jgi:hypothetical protein
VTPLSMSSTINILGMSTYGSMRRRRMEYRTKLAVS